MTANLNDCSSEETVGVVLLNTEVIADDFEYMDNIVLSESVDTITHADTRIDHFGGDDGFEKVSARDTIDIICLAQRHHTRLMYVSMISVETYFDIDMEDVTLSEAGVYRG